MSARLSLSSLQLLIARNIAKHLGHILLAVYLALSCAFALLTPAFSVPDEAAHYLRAYEVRHLHLVNTEAHDGIPIPCTEYLAVAKSGPRARVAYYQPAAEAESSGNEESCQVTSRNSANIYFAAPYMFSALGLAVGEAFGFAGAEHKLIIARLFNAVAASLIMFAGFRRRSSSIDALLFLAMFPATLTQMGSLSADSITLALSFRFAFSLANALAAVGAEAVGERKLLMVVGFLLGMGKTVLGLFAFSSLGLLYQGREGARSSNRRVVAGTIALAVAGMLIARPQVSPYIGNNAVPSEQMQFVIWHPLSGVAAFLNTMTENVWSYAGQLVFRLPVDPQRLPLSITVLMCFVFLAVSAQPGFERGVRLAVLGAAVALTGASALSMYLFYNPVGYNLILGLQGRYFLPVLLLLPFTLAGILPTVPVLARIRGALLALPVVLSIVTLV